MCWDDNYSTTHICKYLFMSKVYSEVASCDEPLATRLVGRRSAVEFRWLRLVLLQDAGMSGGVPGPLGYVAGHSGLLY